MQKSIKVKKSTEGKEKKKEKESKEETAFHHSIINSNLCQISAILRRCLMKIIAN